MFIDRNFSMSVGVKICRPELSFLPLETQSTAVSLEMQGRCFLRFAPFILLFASILATAQSNPVPLINLPLEPTSVAPGGPAFTLTVNGTGFVSGSVVNWNSTALATTFVSASQLTANVPASLIVTASTASITVSSLAPGGGTSNVVFLTIASPVSSLVFTPVVANFGTPLGYIPKVADLNGDAKLDLVYLIQNNSNVVVQLGNGDGSFQPPLTFSTGSQPNDTVIGDFNGDGKLDLAIANLFDNTLSILLGNGDGTLQPQIIVPNMVAPLVLFAGDFNGDGKLDLAVGKRFGDGGDVGGVSILLGNGDGTFQNQVNYDAGVGAFFIAGGDFNGDGQLDIVYLAGTTPLELRLLKGNGDGTFQLPQSFPSDPNIEALQAVDLNGDRKLDLITADLGGGAFVFLGNGDGTFQSAVQYSAGDTARGLTTSDFNADGNIDVALANEANFFFLLGNGDGTFQVGPDFATTPSALGIGAGDFNNDGKMDVVVAVPDAFNNDHSMVVFLQGQFPALTPSPLTLTFPQQAVGTTSLPQAITLTNTGTATMTLIGISITGTNASVFAQTSTCGSTLASNTSCQVNVTFSPTAPVNATAAVSITDNAPGSPQTVALAGSTPPAPVATLLPRASAFPTNTSALRACHRLSL
jgi:hypothetical protein